MAKTNPLLKIRIANLRTSQSMWASTSLLLSDQIYAVGLLRKFYETIVANLGPALADGVVTLQERDDAINTTLGQVLPVNDPNTPGDESVSVAQFMEWHDRFLDPDGQLLWLDNEDIQNPDEIIDSRLADLAGEIRKLLGMKELAIGEIDTIENQIQDIELLQENETNSI